MSMIVGLVLTVLAAGSAPWWWPKVTDGQGGPIAPPSRPPVTAPASSATPDEPTPSPTPTQTTTRPPTIEPSFEEVDLQPLCDSGDCSGTQRVGDTLFSYTDKAQANRYPNYREHKAFDGGRTSCRSLKVEFAGDKWVQDDERPGIDYLKFVQETRPPVYAKVGVGKVGSVEVQLDGGPLLITAARANDPGVHNSYVLLRITGSCATPDGLAIGQ
ncbi:hypothetical protein AB0F81_15605 [Actinoplanes sp. NPDC024001]|uniref:hypothetical protein n=1 Tax=Actinoplanes sp. NPDC024001 TaxID=3154598 RepID=UPI0033E4911B